MELRHLRHFIAVADALSFSKAAQKLHMAQPPLSQSIRRLEESLGVQLFQRVGRGIELTRAGRVFLEQARVAIRHADLAGKLALREAAPIPEIRVSFTPTAMHRFLMPLLLAYREATPTVHVRLTEQPSPLQVAPVMAGDCDAAFVGGGTIGIEEFESLVVERAILVAAVPAQWPLGDRDAISLPELAEFPFILPPPQDYSTESDTLLSLFRQAGVMPHLTQATTHVTTTLGLVGAGFGCTVTTSSAEFSEPRNVRFIPISNDGAPIDWELKMIWRPNPMADAAADFVRFVTDYVGNKDRQRD